jgi:DeoR family fructose operon transcriptional repressor
MLSIERHREILGRLQRIGSVRVSELALSLKVTEETIRRDLDKLSQEGSLVRIRGGAVPVQTDQVELPFDVRETVNLREKQEIAFAAVRFVEAGQVLALDASSTAREFARVLPDTPLTVVTNSLAITTALARRERIRIVSTGGVLDGPHLAYDGIIAEQALERFNINKLFFSVKGVDLERGLSVAADGHARTKRRMMDLAEQIILLVDGSKFNQRAVEFFADVRDVDVVITDSLADVTFVDELRDRGVEVYRAGVDLEFARRSIVANGRAQASADPDDGAETALDKAAE